MEILVYQVKSACLELLAVCDNATSILWKHRFYSGSTFNIVVPATLDNIGIFTKNRVVELMKPNLAKMSSRSNSCGMITSVNIASSDDGEFITINGVSFDGMLDRRILSEWKSSDTVMQTICRNAGPLALEGRRFEATIFDDALDCPGIYDQNMKYKKLSEYVQSVGQAAGWGVQSCIVHNEVDKNNKTLEPHILIYGKYVVDRSVTQQINRPIVFSDMYENAVNFEHTYDENGSISATMIVSPSQFDVSNHIDISQYSGYFDNNSSGYNRIEKYQKIDPVTTIQIRGSAEEPVSWIVLDKPATEKMAKKVSDTVYVLPTDNFTCEIVLQQNWEEIFEVGDIVTVQCQAWGRSENKCVAEVTEFYDANSTEITATLGEPSKSLIEILTNK